VKKTIKLLEIIVVSTIICLTQASCSMFDDLLIPRLKVVNKYDLPITKVGMKIIIGDFSSKEYTFEELNIPKGKSKTFTLDSYFFFDSYSAPYSAEVIVYFGDMYSYKELRFNDGRTTTATLNVNGILE